MSTTPVTLPETPTAGLTAADAVWIATVMLHHRFPQAEGFEPTTIYDEALVRHLTSTRPRTVYQHIVQHVTATQPANPNRRRMLTELPDGRRRLFLEGDDFHPSRNGGQFTPKPEDLPENLRSWLGWYDTWSKAHPSRRPFSPAVDPLEALEGSWTFGDGDTYLREMREGWEGRP